jgi:hypothetical protein
MTCVQRECIGDGKHAGGAVTNAQGLVSRTAVGIDAFVKSITERVHSFFCEIT